MLNHYIKLNQELSQTFIEKIIKGNAARKEAVDMLDAACDRVLTSYSWGRLEIHFGFNSKQEGEQWKIKKPLHDGLYLHEPKVRTDQAALQAKANKLANSVPSLNEQVKTTYPVFRYESIGKHIKGKGFPIESPSFGFNGELIFGSLPVADSESLCELPEGWVEITSTEFKKLEQGE